MTARASECSPTTGLEPSGRLAYRCPARSCSGVWRSRWRGGGNCGAGGWDGLARSDDLHWPRRITVGPVQVITPRRLRDELLSLWRFDSLREAQVIIEDWRIDDTTNRPHTAHAPGEVAGDMATAHPAMLVSFGPPMLTGYACPVTTVTSPRPSGSRRSGVLPGAHRAPGARPGDC